MPSRNTPRTSTASRRSTASLQKTEILIHVYDLLPVSSLWQPARCTCRTLMLSQPGRLSSFLWTIGASLLHSGVVINGKEYAYGGHDRRGVTGVYWTKPKTEPPGGTFKCEILHGFSFASQAEVDVILRDASEEFLGTSYNLLTKNCNHFTSYLCKKLTSRSGPGWLNRAASIGVALPCVVPRDWIEPPEYDTADGELLDDEEEHVDERSGMLKPSPPRFLAEAQRSRSEETEWDSEEERRRGGSGKGKKALKDTSGRRLPAAERAPN
jgi:deubiquitinase DESI2